MASGSYNISTGNQYISGYVEWSESNININNNTSDLTMNVYLHRTNTYSGTPTQITNVNLTRTFYIAGETISSTQRATITIPNDHSYVLVASTTKYGLVHNSDGSLSISIGFAMSPSSGTTGFTVSRQDSTATLYTIPRTSVLNSASINLTSNVISWDITRYSSSFSDNITVYSGSNSFTISSVGTSSSITLNSSQLNTLYAIIGTSTSSTVSAYVTTYNGGSWIGTSNTVSIPISLPNYTLSWTSSTCEDNVSTYDSYKNSASDLIANLSNPKLIFSAQSSTGSNYGRTIAYTINNIAATSPTVITSYVGQSIVLKASDGRTAKDITYTPNNTVIPYQTPTLACQLKRTSPTASTATVTLTGSYYDGDGLTNLSTLALSFAYTETGGTQQTITNFTITTSTTNHIISFTATANITGLDYTKSVSYTASMTDLLGISSGSVNDSIPRGMPVWNAYIDSNNENNFNVNGKGYVNGQRMVCGELLWENQSPTNEFAAQTITLSKDVSNYDKIDILFDSFVPYCNYVYVSTVHTNNHTFYASNLAMIYNRCRSVVFTDGNKIRFDEGKQYDVSTGEVVTTNARMVPLKVIGYKNIY